MLKRGGYPTFFLLRKKANDDLFEKSRGGRTVVFWLGLGLTSTVSRYIRHIYSVQYELVQYTVCTPYGTVQHTTVIFLRKVR
jgi:hypothetical protein